MPGRLRRVLRAPARHRANSKVSTPFPRRASRGDQEDSPHAFLDIASPRRSDVDATWTTQQAELSSHDWVVLDHAPGTSFGLGVTATATHVFTAGSMLCGNQRFEGHFYLES